MHNSRPRRLFLPRIGRLVRRGRRTIRTFSFATATAARLPIASGGPCGGGGGVVDGVRRNAAGDPELRLCRGAERQDRQAGEKGPDLSSPPAFFCRLRLIRNPQ